MGKRDVKAGILLLLFGIASAILALQHPVKATYGLGPGFWPLILSVALVGLSIILIVSGRAASHGHSGKPDVEHSMFPKPVVLFGCMAVLLIAAALLEIAGFIIIIGLTITAYVKLIKPNHTWPKSLVIGMVSSLIIYTAFKGVLGINLPEGVLLQWIY